MLQFYPLNEVHETMKMLSSLWVSALLLFGVPVIAQETLAQPPRVLASVHPLALMAASIVPEEQLSVLLPPGVTPHDFSLRPSDIDTIQNADIILWAGARAEPYLRGFVQRWPEKQWIDVSSFYEQGMVNDAHWWFSTTMMTRAQQALAQALQQDSSTFAAQVEQAVTQAKQQLAPLKQRGFFVFHRAYDHWVQDMQLNQLGAFTISPERKPGAKTLQTMRDQLSRGEVVCVFSEPEFPSSLVQSVVKGIDVKQGELDPMAMHIPLQANGYALFIEDLATRFERCLAP